MNDENKIKGGGAKDAASAQAMGDAQRDRRLAKEQAQAEAETEAAERGKPVREIIITPNGSATVQRGRDGKVFIEIREKKEEREQIQQAAVATPDPFEPIPVVGVAAVTFEPGTVTSGGNISPTVGGVPIATVARPQLPITVTGTLYLEAKMDGAGHASAVAIRNEATTPPDTFTLKHRTLADVTLAGVVVTVTARPVRASLMLYLCDGLAIWIT